MKHANKNNGAHRARRKRPADDERASDSSLSNAYAPTAFEYVEPTAADPFGVNLVELLPAPSGRRKRASFPDSDRPVYVRKQSQDCLYWAYHCTWECLAALQSLVDTGLIAKNKDLGKNWFLGALISRKDHLDEWQWRAELAYRLVELELIEARGKLVGEAGNKFVRLCGVREVNEHAAVIELARRVYYELPCPVFGWIVKRSECDPALDKTWEEGSCYTRRLEGGELEHLTNKFYEEGTTYLRSFNREGLHVQRLLDAEYAKAYERRRANGPSNAFAEIAEEIAQHAEGVKSQKSFLEEEKEAQISGEPLGKGIGDSGRGARWFSLFVEMGKPWLCSDVTKSLSDLGRELRTQHWSDEGWNLKKHQARLTAGYQKLLSSLKSDADTLCPTFSDSPDVSVNDARDEWIYKQCCDLVKYPTIISRLAKDHPEWESINEPGGIRAAAKRYTERRGLPPIPKRKGGRPSSENRRAPNRRRAK